MIYLSRYHKCLKLQHQGSEKKPICSFKCFLYAGEEYRRGNLKAAIATWKSILVFDAHNVEIKKAIQTASMQLKNLKKNF